MNPKIVTQLVPKLSPEVDGLGDYALNLACQLRQDYGIETQFIVSNPQWQGKEKIEGFCARKIQERSIEGLLTVLSQNAPLLLHYEGYGYAKRGYPQWLLQGLKRWKNTSQQRLVTMFHEVYPYHAKPIWTSGFWLTPFQRGLVIKLIQLCDRIVTSKQSYADLLQHLSQGTHPHVTSLPIFCNMGEPHNLRPLAQRPPRLIIFGHYNSRRQVYENHQYTLSRICQDLNLKEILDIGVPTGIKLPQINHITIQELGITPADKISHLMSNAIAGFLSFISPDYLAKSGVYSAYCAHKMLPIVTTKGTGTQDNLSSNIHYWIANRQTPLTLTQSQKIADQAYHWYHTHNRSKHAQYFANLITESSPDH